MSARNANTKSRLLAFALAAAAVTPFGLPAQDSRPSTVRAEKAADDEKDDGETKPKDEVEHWLAITGGDVHLGTGQVLRRASVLVGDDKIREVGHDLQIPEGAQVIDATGKVVTPGFVAVKASGMGSPYSLKEGEVKDSLNPFDPSIKMGLAAGVTSFVASFDDGSDKPGGRTAVLKPGAGELEQMVVAENSVYSMRVPLDPKQWQELRELVDKAREKLDEERAEREKAEKPEEEKSADAAPEGKDDETKDKKGKKEKPAKGLDELVKVLRREAVLWIGSQQTFDEPTIRQALKVAELLDVGVVLDNPVTAWVVADEVAATDSMAIIDPRLRVRPDPARPDSTGSNIASSGTLARAGVPIAVRSPGGRFGGGPTLGTGGILGQDLHTLHIDAAFAVRGGMDNRKALRTITLDAARIAGVASRVGSIEAGKDADLLILDGDPLHYRTFVETAVVNGKVVYEKDKEPFYSHITR